MSVYERHDVSHPSWMSLSSNQLTCLFGTLRHPTVDLAQSMQQCNAHSRICHKLWMELCVTCTYTQSSLDYSIELQGFVVVAGSIVDET